MQQLLIVEDDLTLNEGLCKALKENNRSVVSCENIADARAQFNLGTVSCVILDINLPDGSGLDFLSEIKSGSPETSVILLTANDTDRDIVGGQENVRVMMISFVMAGSALILKGCVFSVARNP